jgi:NADH-quinone oxidoreductase subunit J
MIEVAFYGFAMLTIVSAIAILLTRNVMYAAFCLLLTLVGVAALFVLLGADFLAVTQLLVYVGGVLILLIFGLMLTQRTNRENNQQTNQLLTTHLNHFWGGSIVLVVFGLLCWAITNSKFTPNSLSIPNSTVPRIGTALMTDYVWAFEITGILLLVALVGAAYIADSTKKELNK